MMSNIESLKTKYSKPFNKNYQTNPILSSQQQQQQFLPFKYSTLPSLIPPHKMPSQSPLNSSLFNTDFQHLNHDYLYSLHQKQQKLQEQLVTRKQQKRKAGLLYQDYVKREMEMLLKEREKMTQRNEAFLADSKKYSLEIKKALPELINKEDELKKAKLQYVQYLDKMINRKGRNTYVNTVTLNNQQASY